MQLPPYRVSAFNGAKASENKIHDDATARRFGFKGGFVPGVHVYAYMSHQPVQHWGRTWLERGTAEARFRTPVYEGDIADVTATANAAEGLDLEVHSAGELCATGQAALAPTGSAHPGLSDYREVPPRQDRQPASETTLAVGDWLGMRPFTVTEDYQLHDLAEVREADPLYDTEQLVHPGTLLRCCNWVLSHNVILPAWIHTGSAVRNLGLARVGDTLSVRARVTSNYEHKGHKWVVLDALVVANETSPVLQATHTAIYRPRQLADAA